MSYQIEDYEDDLVTRLVEAGVLRQENFEKVRDAFGEYANFLGRAGYGLNEVAAELQTKAQELSINLRRDSTLQDRFSVDHLYESAMLKVDFLLIDEIQSEARSESLLSGALSWLLMLFTDRVQMSREGGWLNIESKDDFFANYRLRLDRVRNQVLKSLPDDSWVINHEVLAFALSAHRKDMIQRGVDLNKFYADCGYKSNKGHSGRFMPSNQGLERLAQKDDFGYLTSAGSYLKEVVLDLADVCDLTEHMEKWTKAFIGIDGFDPKVKVVAKLGRELQRGDVITPGKIINVSNGVIPGEENQVFVTLEGGKIRNYPMSYSVKIVEEKERASREERVGPLLQKKTENDIAAINQEEMMSNALEVRAADWAYEMGYGQTTDTRKSPNSEEVNSWKTRGNKLNKSL